MPLKGGGGGGMLFGGGGEATGCATGEATFKVGVEGVNGDGVNGLGCAIPGVVGEVGAGLVAASIAFILASLSPLSASIIPESIPVRKVEIGTSISKNFWSIGDIALSG